MISSSKSKEELTFTHKVVIVVTVLVGALLFLNWRYMKNRSVLWGEEHSVAESEPLGGATEDDENECHTAKARAIDSALKAEVAQLAERNAENEFSTLWRILPRFYPHGAMIVVGFDAKKTNVGADGLHLAADYAPWTKFYVESAQALVHEMRLIPQRVARNFTIVTAALAPGAAKVGICRHEMLSDDIQKSTMIELRCWMPPDAVLDNEKTAALDCDPSLASFDPSKTFDAPGKWFTTEVRSLQLSRLLDAHEVPRSNVLVMIVNEDYGLGTLRGGTVLAGSGGLCPLVLVYRDALLSDADAGVVKAHLGGLGYIFRHVGGTTIASRLPSLLSDSA